MSKEPPPWGFLPDGTFIGTMPGEKPYDPMPRIVDEDEPEIDDLSEEYEKNLQAEDAEWHEEDHPRGQPENAGQFGPGGGGEAEAKAKQAHRESLQSIGKIGKELTKLGKTGEEALGEKPPKKSTAAALYKTPTMTADQIIAAFPGASEAIQKTRARLAKATPTAALVSEGGFKNEDGTYTKERQAIHMEIVKEMFTPEAIAAAMPKRGEKPVLTLLGGRGGSGKSWLTGKDGPVDPSTSFLLDSDAIKSQLPGYEGWNAAQFHDEATDITNLCDRRATALGINCIHDSTLKTESSVAKRVALYESSGYELEGYYMHVQPEVAATRAMSRYSKGGTFTGRFVPPEVILSNVSNEANFDKLSSGMRRWKVYDNNAEVKGGKGKGPRLVDQSDEDEAVRRQDG